MTDTQGFTLFETAVGTCGIAWGDHGVLGVQLPEPSDQHMRTRLRRRFPRATEALSPVPGPPAAVQAAIDDIVALLDGTAPSDLSGIALDMHDVPDFHQRVYAVARTIPPGSTLSYGEIAARLGEPAWPAARDVGQALAQNPFPIVVPCHRVLAAHGKPGGFSARGGLTTKFRLLAIEAAQTAAAPRTESETATARAHSASAVDTPLFAQLQEP